LKRLFGNQATGMRLAGFIILLALLAFSMLGPAVLAQEEEAPPQPFAGPIDPAAGSWILYRGSKTLPDQPAPQPFYLRIGYDYPSGTPQAGTVLEAKVEELNQQMQVTSSRNFSLETVDRLYRDSASGEEGYWAYWLPPGMEDAQAVTIDSALNLTAAETTDYEFKGNKYNAVTMRGEGVELLAEKRTGITLRINREGSSSLEIEDTNMLAQYASWGYYPDNREVSKRLENLVGNHPDLVEVSSLGKSTKGRDIWLAHITDFTSDEEKRSFFISAAMEGNAPEGSAFLLDLLDEMAQRAEEDEQLADLLNRLNVYVIPMVNPDGIQRWLAMPDPAQSMELSSQAPRNGNLVMINRNFDIYWESGNRNPASVDYAGPEPFSEKESQALRNLLSEISCSLYINLHSGQDALNAPWNWNSNPASNPEKSLYDSIISELSMVFPYAMRVGSPLGPFTGSSTDWAYEGKGASSPLCFAMYMGRAGAGENAGQGAQATPVQPENGDFISFYEPYRNTIYHLMENIHSYLAVDIITHTLRAEVNLPLDVNVEVEVNGKRALPNAKAHLVIPSSSGLKLAALSEKDLELGDLQPGSTAEASWNLEGKMSGTYQVEVEITSSYPEYDNIPGTYYAGMEIVISTQRTWLVLVLLTVLIVLVLCLVFLSMRKHKRQAESG
jgi:hypothetical protein